MSRKLEASKRYPGVYKRDGKWRASYEGPRRRDGSRRQVWITGFATAKEAAEARAQAIAEVRSGGFLEPDRVTVEAWLERWLDQKIADDLKASTVPSYRRTVNRLVDVLGVKRVQELTLVEVEDALRSMARSGGRKGRPLAVSTVKQARDLLRAALTEAVRAGLIGVNPALHARVPRKPSPGWEPRSAPQAPWTLDELRTFLTDDDDRLLPLWHLLLSTGLRRGEALALRWSDVVLDTGEDHKPHVQVRRNRVVTEGDDGSRLIVEQTPKTDASVRSIPLGSAIVATMRQHRAAQATERLASGPAWADEDRVFADELGRGLDPDWISAQFGKRCDRVGVRRIRLHDARHTHATRLEAAGVPISTLSQRLGHSRISTTQNMYVHGDDDAARAAADVFDDLVAGEG